MKPMSHNVGVTFHDLDNVWCDNVVVSLIGKPDEQSKVEVLMTIMTSIMSYMVRSLKDELFVFSSYVGDSSGWE